jgi:chromate transporter
MHPQPISFWQALRYWFRLGFISFGGPAGQIAIMHHDLVEKNHWISEKRFLHALNYCMLLPGPEAQQLATYIGWLMHRTWGGVMAGVLFVLPGFFTLVSLAWIYMSYGHIPLIAGALYGIKPAVVAIVLFAAYRIGARTLYHPFLWMIAVLSFLSIFAFNIPFPAIVLVAGSIGYLGGRLSPALFNTSISHAKTNKHYGPAFIDDATPTPEHARFTWKKLLVVASAGLGIWLMAMGLLCARFGWHGALTQMGWFFTKAALLTFGGAYAVLPYVFQNAVNHYHWLTPTQMMDGLALGETTPGPLIMVVTFVGFVGGWVNQIFGTDALLCAGLSAAVVVSFFTFLPSFVMILLGGPLIESTHSNLSFTAPLTAITAAVVGVILNLGIFFAYHVLWPQGWINTAAITSPDWSAMVLVLAALIALFRYKAGVIPLILASGIAGMALRLAGS